MSSQDRDALRLDPMARWLEGRRRIAGVLHAWRQRAIPDPWSLLLGQMVVASFVVCALTGVFLLFFYEPSTTPVTYDGSYGPLRGLEVSEAFASTMDLSFEVRGGLLMRQVHHWSATVMIAALMLYILRVFFVGAFRKPRELQWVVLFGILLTSMGAGLTGHILPDDLLSGTSLAVLDGLLKGIPVVGTWLSYLVFQGRFPSGAIDTFYPLHVVVLTGLLVLLLPFSGLLNRRPSRLAVRSGGLFFIVSGVLTLMGALVTVNPIWLYGPSDPAIASAGGGSLWYFAFLDGAQRLVPPGWEFVLFNRTWTPAILVPMGVCGVFLGAAMLYPFFERWLTGDKRDHHLPARPRDTPTRTGIGVAGIVFYGVLWIAGGSDVLALKLSLSNEAFVLTLQLALMLGPVAGFMITKRICLGLQRRDGDIVQHGYETGRIVRMPDGEFVEVHRRANAAERSKLLDYETYEPLVARPDVHGHVRSRDRARARLSRWFSEARTSPVAHDELTERDAAELLRAKTGDM